jgi:hypothetical protein
MFVRATRKLWKKSNPVRGAAGDGSLQTLLNNIKGFGFGEWTLRTLELSRGC